jgi:hypothetical protein
MKKITLLFSAAFLAAPVAFGQKTQLQDLLHQPLAVAHRNLQSLAGAAPAAAKTTAQQQRIIGYSTLSVSSGNSLMDSARIRYGSVARGSKHDPNDIGSYYFSYSPEGAYYPRVETFLEQGEIRIKADTVTQRDVNGIYQTTGLSYDGVNRPTQMRRFYYDANAYYGRDRYTMTYDGAGQRTRLQYDLDTVTTAPGSFIPDYTLYSKFGSPAGRILSDSLVPNPTAIANTQPMRLSYNYAGNNISSLEVFVLTNGVYELGQRILFSYDASNRIRTTEIFADYGNGLEPNSKDSLTYTGSNLFPTGNYIMVYTGTAYQIVQSARYTTNAQNLRDTIRYYDDLGSVERYVTLSYNTYGNPDSYRLYVPQNSTTTPEETGRFYYELYDPAAVDPLLATAQNLNATAYPNPVSGVATLSWNAFAGTITLQLADATGRLLETVQAPAATGTYRLDMTHYAPGFYVATFQDQEGRKQTVKIAKQ